MNTAAVTVIDLVKTFGATRALDGVSLDLQAGEVHGIVGENGAGKSTLMKILSGVHPPTSGGVFVRGEAVTFHGVHDALARGIAMIHQELNLVDELSIADNIFLGREKTRAGLIRRRDSHRAAAELMASIDYPLDPAMLVRDLSIAQKQMVEIAKAISCEASVLIMDEPTAVLTRREVESLFALIGRLKRQGVTVVYISHILPEVLAVCDRITVMRDGRVARILDEENTKLASEHQLASLMVGRPMADHFPARIAARQEIRLAISDLASPPDLFDVSFDVHRGEIFGLAGLIGAGRTQCAEAIMGLRRRASGFIRVDGREVKIGGPGDAVASGIGYLSEDRKSAGLTVDMDVVANTTLVSLRRYGRVLIDRKAEEAATAARVSQLGIKTGGLHDAVSTLSGGNQQKVLLAKWLETNPRVLIVDEPTRGVDVGAKEEIYRLIQRLAADGLACVMISSEINELLGMCHRIGVMRMGRLVTILNAAEASEEKIMLAAAGVAAGGRQAVTSALGE